MLKGHVKENASQTRLWFTYDNACKTSGVPRFRSFGKCLHACRSS